MTRADPLVTGVLADLARGLRALQVEFCVIGALVPELLLDVAPRRMTKDADVTVLVESLAHFERVKRDLEPFGFTPTTVPHRLTHRDGGWVDLLPYSRSLAPTGRLQMSPQATLNVAGFDALVPNAIAVTIAPGVALLVAPIPLYVLLKLVAYGDRKERKDLASVLHCLRHYREDDDARYGLEHEGELVPFEVASAYLLGLDARPFLPSVATSIRQLLDQFDNPDAAIVGLVASEDRRVLVEDADRLEVFELFRWFRLATAF
jgi:predicted nucleotidyltransferase